MELFQVNDKILLVQDAIQHLYKNKMFTDITVVCRGTSEEFYAHKLILALHSPVFSDEFYGRNITEHSKIFVEGYTISAVTNMMSYLYGEPVVLENVLQIKETSRIAERYQINELLNICRKKLRGVDVGVPDVLVALEMAVKYEDEYTERKCFELMSRNMDIVFTCEEFLNMDFERARFFWDKLRQMGYLTEVQYICCALRKGRSIGDYNKAKLLNITSLPKLSIDEMVEVIIAFPDFLTNIEISDALRKISLIQNQRTDRGNHRRDSANAESKERRIAVINKAETIRNSVEQFGIFDISLSVLLIFLYLYVIIVNLVVITKTNSNLPPWPMRKHPAEKVPLDADLASAHMISSESPGLSCDCSDFSKRDQLHEPVPLDTAQATENKIHDNPKPESDRSDLRMRDQRHETVPVHASQATETKIYDSPKPESDSSDLRNRDHRHETVLSQAVQASVNKIHDESPKPECDSSDLGIRDHRHETIPFQAVKATENKIHDKSPKPIVRKKDRRNKEFLLQVARVTENKIHDVTSATKSDCSMNPPKQATEKKTLSEKIFCFDFLVFLTILVIMNLSITLLFYQWLGQGTGGTPATRYRSSSKLIDWFTFKLMIWKYRLFYRLFNR